MQAALHVSGFYADILSKTDTVFGIQIPCYKVFNIQTLCTKILGNAVSMGRL